MSANTNVSPKAVHFVETVVRRAVHAFREHDARNPNDPNRCHIPAIVKAEDYLTKVPVSIRDDLTSRGLLNKSGNKYYILLK